MTTAESDLDPDEMRAAVHDYMMRDRLRLPEGVFDLLYTRDYTCDAPQAGVNARRALDAWSVRTGRPTDTLVIGHNATTRAEVQHKPYVHVHTRPLSDIPGVYHLLGPAEGDLGPWINASLDDKGLPAVWRVDVGASRAWWTVNREWEVWPQALCCDPQTGATTTLLAAKPIRTPEQRK